jgi:hypothetical protein
MLRVGDFDINCMKVFFQIRALIAGFLRFSLI